jgi:hypothetical protein
VIKRYFLPKTNRLDFKSHVKLKQSPSVNFCFFESGSRLQSVPWDGSVAGNPAPHRDNFDPSGVLGRNFPREEPQGIQQTG